MRKGGVFMNKFLRWIFGPSAEVRRVPVLLPDRQLDEAELRNALANAKGSPIWDAVLQVLMENYQAAQSQVSTPGMAADPGSLAHAVGGMSLLGDAIGELQDRARGARAELEADALRDARRKAKG